MGLQFYFGPSGAGKSRQLHEDISKWAQREPDKSFFFLVPDQFTMQTQMDLVNASDRKGIMNIDVLSFGRLAHRIFEETGYGTKPVLDDTGKSLVLRRTAASLQEELPVIGRNLSQIGYIHEVKSAISEFKQYGLTPSQIGELADFAKTRKALYYKLKDLQVLYQGFTDYIQDRFITTEETLELLTEAVRKSKLIRGSVMVFDGFTGFTPIQYRLIQQLLTLTERVIVSVTIDMKEDPFVLRGEQELFYLSRKTTGDLCRLAKEVKVERTDDIFIKNRPLPRFGDNQELAHLEEALFRYPVRPCGVSDRTGAVRVLEASTPAEEVREVCIKIRKLVLEEDYCYRDIAVVAGDLETYGDYFEREALIFDIPIFMDRTRKLLQNPFIEYIRSALKIVLQNFSYQSVFHFLRSGLTDFSREEIDLLENYVLALGIRGKNKWSQAFTRKTERFTVEELEKMNSTREGLMELIAPLLSPPGTAGELVEMLYGFVAAGRIQEKLAGYESWFREAGNQDKAREYAQIYRLVMELLEQIYELLREEPMGLQEFADILDAGFGEIQVGIIPGSVDRIVVGDMERSRLKQVKVLFFLGVNDGNIPQSSSKGGIISDIDREFLQESEFELAPTPRQQMYIQRLYLYLNMTKPSHRLYLSYARLNSQGKSIRPSYLVEMIGRLFPHLEIEKTNVIHSSFEQIVGKRDGLTLLARELRNYAEENAGAVLSPKELALFYGLYQRDAQYGPYAQKLMDAAFEHYRHKPLARATALALYGSILENSVSRLEKYAACAYGHFLQYGLRLKEREEFSFQQVDLGNIFHQVLEKFAGKLADNQLTWLAFSEEQGEQLLREALAECAAAYGETILYSNARYEYGIERMYRILRRTIQVLKKQLEEGAFVPESFEMSFSQVENLASVNIGLSEKEKMKLRGRIDRIDTFEDQDHVYVKVIDYKSGSRKFDLAALYYGLQLQLVVYMNVAAEIEAEKHPDKEIVPAALFYYHVEDPMIKAEEELTPSEIERLLFRESRMTGIVRAEEKVVKLLDGNFAEKSDVIPVERKKDGGFSARSGVVSAGSYEMISDFVNHRIRQFGREILEGNIAVNPCQQGGRNSCTYCPYQGVCEFETKTPGYQVRILESPSREEILYQMEQYLQEEKEKE